MTTQSQGTTGHSNPPHVFQLTAELVHGVVKIESDLKSPVHLKPGSKEHDFIFNLRDRTFPSQGVRFCTVDEGVLDIDESTDCPPKNRGIHTDQVDPETVESTDKTARFTDKNSGVGRTLSYALHFKCDDPGQEPIFDPEIRNGGDTKIIDGPSPVLVALAVAAVIALIAAILWAT